MLGAIVGDIIGSWYEANTTDKYDFPLFMDLSRCTDDSIMTTAVAEIILEKQKGIAHGDFSNSMRSWGRRYPNAGYGGHFNRWLADSKAEAYNSWGNGSAMRVSPIALYYQNIEDVLRISAMSAEVSHNHPEGVKGAQAVAYAIFMGQNNCTRDEIRQSISTRFGYDMDRTIEEIQPDYQFEISCQKSVPEAIIAALQSRDFEDAIRLAIFLGGDADTQAAIAGGISETLYGGVPEKLLAFVLPRIPLEILDMCITFYSEIENHKTLAVLMEEKKKRNSANPDGLYRKLDRYSIILHLSVQKKLSTLADDLNGDGITPGDLLKKQLEEIPVQHLKWDWLLRALLNTKIPCIFAESAVIGDGSDWTRQELQLLGEISIAVPVKVFDDGRHLSPKVHNEPFDATLLYTPGPLFQSGQNTLPVDWDLVKDVSIDPESYFKAIETRLLPSLKYASIQAARFGRQALVTIPGIGCGQFAGPFYGSMQVLLESAIRRILEIHSHELSGIRAIWFDPYSTEVETLEDYSGITFMVRPLLHSDHPVPQLSQPSSFSETGIDLNNCELFSIVAWDHVSWPGNDFWSGARTTDDGVKAAATDSMFKLTGVRGKYDANQSSYNPPAPYNNWAEVVQENGMGIRVVDNIVVAG